MAKGKAPPAGQTSITSFFGGGSPSKPKPTKKPAGAGKAAKKTTKQAEVVDVDEPEENEHESEDDKGSDFQQEEEQEQETEGEMENEVEETVSENEQEVATETDEDRPKKTKSKIVASDSSNDPPIHRIPAIFDDLVGRIPQIEGVVKQLQGRKMRVATMCSGTESPLLALELIRRSIKDQFDLDFEMEHVFSCEIEPFKQAYIERNFSPPILFRDVCELGRSHAHTAYGALAPVPGDVDILIAGTSCVDYSNLNNEKQDIDAQGESGRTFRGMLDWVRRHRPPLVILENVCGAPWERVKKYFAQEDYSAEYLRVDTKTFYIPHTRTRVYLLAVNKRQSSIPEQWKKKIKDIQRPASSTLDAFLLPTDDPRIHQARERLVKESFNAVDRRTGRTDWGRCESRHQRARLEEELGSKRPLTNWEDGGYCKLPDFAWNDWGVGQVERVWDLMDISLMRSAQSGVDASYKTVVWNLSQNVDRTIGSSKMGICPCLTPTMIPYITNRGGPMVGLEALSMQGLPVDELLLTRESEDQLADLAGNAMSTTVVGACMLVALVTGKQLLRAGDDKKTYEEKYSSGKVKQEDGDEDDDVVDVVMMTDKLGIAESLEKHISGEDQLVEKPLDLAATSRQPLSELLINAQKSARLCECEGRKDMTDRTLSRCKDCGSTSCSKCGGRPEHNPEVIDVVKNQRLSPSLFARELKSSLPMALILSEITQELLDDLKKRTDVDVSAKVWEGWSEAVLRAAKEELRFAEPKRQDIWIVAYQSNFATLELSLHPQQPEWRFFAKPADDEPANSKMRTLLEAPVGRLRCTTGLFDGRWEFALPAQRKLTLTIEGSEPVPAWEARLGLQGKAFRDKTVHSRLEIAVRDADMDKLDRDISGTYVLLDKCGTANGALHRRDTKPGDGDVPPLFMMFDPLRCGDPKEDVFVFSISKRRLEYGEHRPLICRLTPRWRQSSVVGPQEVEAMAPCQWIESSETRLEPAPDRKAFFAVPSNKLVVNPSVDACKSANAVLVCRVPLHSQAGPEWPVGAWKEVDKVHERLTFRALAWLTERVRNDDDFNAWQEVPYKDLHFDCERCAPPAPAIGWARNEKNKIVAVEDAAQAGAYERALKRRPAPFVTQLKVEENGIGHVRIGINIVSLMHRALSRLPSKGRAADATLAWRLDTDFTPMAKLSMPKFKLKSNKQDDQHTQPPDFHTLLRPEQLRSLTWMLQQEEVDAPPFVEEEISEAILEPLNWRVEGRAQRPNRVRGGVLADQVGYGKTAISLGLINCTKDEIKTEFKEALKREGKSSKKTGTDGDPLYGRIPSKATLCIVPPHLTKQWVKEASKFIDQSSWRYKIVEVASVAQVNKLTVEAVQNADFIVVASNLFKSPNYVQNLSAFAAGGGLPENQDGRYFNARLAKTLEALKDQVELLKAEEVAEVWDRIEKAAAEETHEEQLTVKSKRLKGKSYRDQAMALDEEAPKPKVSKAVPRHGQVMEVVVPRRGAKVSSSLPSSPASSATEVTTAAEEDSDVPQPARPRRLRKKLVIDISDDEDVKMEDAPKAKGKAKKSVKATKPKRAAKDDESSDYDPSGAEESDAEMDVDVEESGDEAAVPKKGKGKAPAKAPAKGKGKGKAATSTSSAASSDAETSSEAMDVDEAKGKGKASSAKKRKRDADDTKQPAKKKKRADADPWGLKGLRKVPDEWKKLKAPPFEVFHFARKLVDEYTYLEGKTLSMISNISAERHWVLSGTPPVQDFGALKTISAFLNIHLGVDDDGEGESAKKRKREQTAVEKFHSFREVHSLEWHAHRHVIGQAFLDQFVRQNIAEIDEIPCAEVIEKIDLPAAERAIYLELEHHLRALDMTIKRGKKTESDREKRLAQVLGESSSAEEALLKRCSHFDLETKKDNAMKACEIIVAERKEQLENCKKDLLKKLQVGVETQKKINAFQVDESLFQEYIRVSRTEGVGDEDATKIVEELLEKAQAKAPLAPAANKSGATAKARGGTKGKADDGLTGKQKEQIWGHREHTHEIRRVTKELTGRVRSLRYFTAVRDLQKQREAPPLVRCFSEQCQGREVPLDEIAVLSSCGHMGCLKCVTEYAEREECIFASRGESRSRDGDMSDDDGPKTKAAPSKTACKAAARVLNVVRGSTLGVDDAVRDKNAKHYGLKLEKVIELIKKRIPKEERVLIFVQFPDLMKKVGEALESAHIKFLEIKGSASQRSKNLDKYQNDSSERVLLLNVMDESASGANLTGANHAIFLSPLLAPSQEIYDACETQAIGRVRRYGQTKHVTIWRFLSTNTIDTQIYHERTGKEVN
ncbi:uncharacterized protein PHACADRAFT_213538 [Phanerochaete carnosa HHB-10118-sp]|uniref:Helicase C-terminal domain-containing protein n=1 Tax=Phanerochaete carnosa (strain HHB-10118-sp) TaxID=650164 RepID=K5VUZ6_PHACS|nr:uncharacterized protein PHACADRAFT_213538 [Phanerochaete carnosa HHB-10118-sp]EKM50640.1 hypothetical protein PHACADRAFT_213538 [Phanerochaete carnosa HHB-10118-sp]